MLTTEILKICLTIEYQFLSVDLLFGESACLYVWKSGAPDLFSVYVFF